MTVKKDQIEVLNVQFDNLVETTEIIKAQENRLKKLEVKKYASDTKLGQAVVAYHQAMNKTLANRQVSVVKATASGIVTTVNIRIGQAIAADTEVLRILPRDGKLFAKFSSQSEDIRASSWEREPLFRAEKCDIQENHDPRPGFWPVAVADE